MSEPTELEREEQELLDSDDDIEVPPPDIVAYSELRSCADIYRMFKDDALILNPEFQREEVWQNTAKTRFVDSLIKQLPIPSLCLSLDYKTEQRQVIDGLQRISTIVRFLGDQKWNLSRLSDVDPRISGKSNSDFRDPKSELNQFYRRVQNATLPITVIRCDSSNRHHQGYLFTIFHRLNTGGLKLNNQEIRNCIYSGPFNDMLRTLGKNERLRAVLGFDVKQVTRFKVEELALRFYAFYERSEQYSGKLARFLNDFMADHKASDEQWLKEREQLLLATTDIVASRLKEQFLVKRQPLAIVESIFVGIGRNIEKVAAANSERTQACFAEIQKDPEFSEERLRGGLANSERIKGRLNAAVNAFSKI